MTSRGKKRVVSLILSIVSTTTAATIVTVATVLAGVIIKLSISEVSKPELFTGSRTKFRSYCT